MSEPSVMFRLRNEPGLVVIEVSGDIGADEAGQLRDLALLAVADNNAVVIDLGGVESLSVEAAGLLLFPVKQSGVPSEAITVRTGSPPARNAVLQAYARHRVGQAQA